MSTFSLASAHLSKLCILCLNNLLDGDLCKKYLFISIFSLFWFSNMILSDALTLHVSQLQTQQLMSTNQVTHRIFNTDLTYSCANFIVKIDEKYSLNGGF